MSQTVEQTLSESIPVRPQAEESRGARAGRLTDTQMYDIMGPRDVGMALLRRVGLCYLLGLVVPLGLGLLCWAAGEKGYGEFFILLLIPGLICCFCVTMHLAFRFQPSWGKRKRRIALYDAIQRGSVQVDFYFPFRALAYETYFFISKDRFVHFNGWALPLEDVSRISTRGGDGQTAYRFICVHFRNLAEPVQSIWLKSEYQVEQQYDRLRNYLGWS